MSNDQVEQWKKWRETNLKPAAAVPQVFAATRPAVQLAIARELAAARKSGSGPALWRKQCVATDAETGKRCTLLEHGLEVAHNASGREFRNPLAAGAEPRRAIDGYALQHHEAAIETSRTGLSAGDARATRYSARSVSPRMPVAANEDVVS